jgi:hypothetical protein
MEENVRKELDSLEDMLRNWKTGFMSWASPDGDNDHVLEEFSEEIQTNIYPYVKRLFETNHLNESEAKEFMNYCLSQVEDLRHQLSKAETDESTKEA